MNEKINEWIKENSEEIQYSGYGRIDYMIDANTVKEKLKDLSDEIAELKARLGLVT